MSFNLQPGHLHLVASAVQGSFKMRWLFSSPLGQPWLLLFSPGAMSTYGQNSSLSTCRKATSRSTATTRRSNRTRSNLQVGVVSPELGQRWGVLGDQPRTRSRWALRNPGVGVVSPELGGGGP